MWEYIAACIYFHHLHVCACGSQKNVRSFVIEATDGCELNPGLLHELQQQVLLTTEPSFYPHNDYFMPTFVEK